jgi:O-antigen/teichoic acid export membrane protein
MGADWFRTLMVTPAPLLLGYYSDMSAVAMYQVVIPLVALNKQAAQSFGMLFEPAASRLVARHDRSGLEHLYWRAALWVAVLTFPGFAVSFALAEPLTVLLYGDRYAFAAPILSLLAVGTFIDACAGFNDATLRVAGKTRWLIGVNAVGAMLNVLLNLLLIPRMGALGAGIATGTALFVYSVLKQICLWRATGVHGLHPAYAQPYGVMALATAGLVILRMEWGHQLWILIPGVTLAVLAVVWVARATLSISDTFPELARWPLLKRIFG